MRLFVLLFSCAASSNPSFDLSSSDLSSSDLSSFDLSSFDLSSSADLATSFQLTTDFSGSDGAAWPAPWTVLGGVASATLLGGRGRLIPMTSGYSLARMGAAASVKDAEVTFSLLFEDLATQGIGFYVRQNGGWLANTTPHGQGYALFVEGFRGARMAMWHELDGVEQEIANSATTLTLSSGTLYSARFRVTQEASLTRLQARLWPAAQSEPAAWQIDITDGTAVLQNLSGGFAVDSWSTATSGSLSVGTQVDDIVIHAP